MYLTFDDGSGRHRMECGDWETSATFFNLSRQHGDDAALAHLKRTYEIDYPSKGVVLALGTVKKRPRQWLLLGIVRLNETKQPNLL